MKTCDYSQPREMRFHLRGFDIIPMPFAMHLDLSLLAIWIALMIQTAIRLVMLTNRPLKHRLHPASEAGKE